MGAEPDLHIHFIFKAILNSLKQENGLYLSADSQKDRDLNGNKMYLITQKKWFISLPLEHIKYSLVGSEAPSQFSPQVGGVGFNSTS